MSSAESVSAWRTRLGAASRLEVVAVSARAEVELEALAVGGNAFDLLLAQHGAKVLERRAVADPRPEQPCAVVGDDRLGAIAAPAIADLADVLKHAQELDSLAGASGGDLIEIGQRRDVGGLIEAEQQRRIDRAARRRRAVKRGGHHVGDQRREQPAQAPLVLHRGDQVERVAPRQQPV